MCHYYIIYIYTYTSVYRALYSYMILNAYSMTKLMARVAKWNAMSKMRVGKRLGIYWTPVTKSYTCVSLSSEIKMVNFKCEKLIQFCLHPRQLHDSLIPASCEWSLNQIHSQNPSQNYMLAPVNHSSFNRVVTSFIQSTIQHDRIPQNN